MIGRSSEKQVVRPAFEDPAAIAWSAGADDVASELGDPTDFFAGITLARTKRATEPKGFRTVGAKERAALYTVNEAAMQKLGYRD
ncbi:MAG: hypothetical protein AAGG07_14650 [Planctomycetota bacterium]